VHWEVEGWRGNRVTRSGSQVWAEGYVTFESPLSALPPDESCAWALINGGFRLDLRLPHRLIHARHWIRFELDSSQLAMPSIQPCLPCSWWSEYSTVQNSRVWRALGESTHMVFKARVVYLDRRSSFWRHMDIVLPSKQ
jgi:hypothetical protein